MIVDDFTISAGTLVDAARVLKERGATEVHAMVSHALLRPESLAKLEASEIERLYVTDSVEPQLQHEKIEVVSVAGLFGEAIRRISQKESISVLFS